MVVGPSRDEAEPVTNQGRCQCGSVGHNLAGVPGERRIGSLTEGDSLGRYVMLQWTTLRTREDGLVYGHSMLLAAENAATTRTTQSLVGSEGDNIAVGHGVRMNTTSYQTGDVGGVEHEESPHLVSDLAQGGGLDNARVSRRAGHDELRSGCTSLAMQFVHVDSFITTGQAVGNEVVKLPAGIDR